MAKIDDLKNKLQKQKNLRDKYKKAGKDSLVKKFDTIINEIENKIKEEEKVIEKKIVEETKPKKRSTIAGTMTKSDCDKLLEEMRTDYLQAESRKKKNIKSGRADKSGVLKASSSLKNEAESIDNKSDSGQTLNKAEQKVVTINIDNIVRSCTEMIKKQKDSEDMVRTLIRRLQGVLSDIKSGKIKYEG